MSVTKHLKRFFFAELVKDQPWFLSPCSQPGFTEPAPLDAAGALLPHPCTLTCLSRCGVPRLDTIGGMFLWHYPHGHPHWALPSKFGLSGARTFLRLDREERVRNHLRLLSPSSSLVASCLFFSQSYSKRHRAEGL